VELQAPPAGVDQERIEGGSCTASDDAKDGELLPPQAGSKRAAITPIKAVGRVPNQCGRKRQ